MVYSGELVPHLITRIAKDEHVDEPKSLVIYFRPIKWKAVFFTYLKRLAMAVSIIACTSTEA